MMFSAKMRRRGVSLKVLTLRKKRNFIGTPMLKKGIILVIIFYLKYTVDILILVLSFCTIIQSLIYFSEFL